MNQWFVNLEDAGVRLVQIDDEAVIPEVHIELERSLRDSYKWSKTIRRIPARPFVELRPDHS
jgi:hypothetical protein